MADSWMLISYGNFEKTKKLFSYDRFGIHTLPIFEDPMIANEFMESLSELYRKEKKFTLNYCESKQKLIDIIDLITIVTYDLEQVIVDPSASNESTPERFSIGEKVYKIQDFKESLLQKP